ncbi:FAD-binding oxidoreductase [Aliiroseovarius sp. F20344]|uniref:NAD(P)/FAD-dependent oxidoreductase n=1 Tax=Aliiroseovarius sp. F20344 TaxID=2926414 RepID=UPI001FF4CDBC|nr:FAD-binding oxidoreductase [Aliiroseovarius sp. F20344]MCK0143058.1 FAD-binding oxidoreductase [Aliiroseovarius sp. F20344]
MTRQVFAGAPKHSTYDVVIVGGAIMGSSVAWWLSRDPDFNGRILVIERDPSFAQCSTAHTNSCIRQQFSEPLNVQISQFTLEFIKDLRAQMGGDERVENLRVQDFGYLYLADTEQRAETLKTTQAMQCKLGASTRIMTRNDLADAYPFYNLDDIILGSHGAKDEGYWDGGALFDWFRRKAIEAGVEYLSGEVVGVQTSGARATSVTLADGTNIGCGQLVNAAGPRAAVFSKMAGLDVPIEPRKRFTWVVSAADPLDRPLPLTVDPSGIHFRQDGPETYMIGAASEDDVAVTPDDFHMDHSIWETHVWPHVATRIPQFEALKIVTEWAGHYAYNTLDQNAVLGPHPELENFFFINGFSGHGLQQAPAMGRGLTELITHGGYRSMDLSPFGYERIVTGTPFGERAVI